MATILEQLEENVLDGEISEEKEFVNQALDEGISRILRGYRRG
jgi:hypothetical protein